MTATYALGLVYSPEGGCVVDARQEREEAREYARTGGARLSPEQAAQARRLRAERRAARG